VLLSYVLIDLLISALRGFWLSYAAIKTYLVGQTTALSPKGLREHACSLVYIWLLCVSAAFFRSPCPDNWAEIPMMTSAFVIFILMWLPAFARICQSKNKCSAMCSELTADFKLLWQYTCGTPDAQLDSPGVTKGKGAHTLGISATIGPRQNFNTPMPTPRIAGCCGDYDDDVQNIHDDIVRGNLGAGQLASVNVNPVAKDELRESEVAGDQT